jgi:hypothetical protein
MTSFSFVRRRTAHRDGPARRPDDAAAAPAADTSPGPGWFQSSWELRCGLVVHEAPAPDAPDAPEDYADSGGVSVPPSET